MANGYKQALADFEAAVRAHEMRGSRPPEEWETIDKRYERTKAALINKLSYRKLAAELRYKAP